MAPRKTQETPKRPRKRGPPSNANDPNRPLSEKESKFIENFAIHGNATRAAREAGYQAKNDIMLRSTAYELRQKPAIRKALQDLRDRAAEHAEITVSKVLQRWWQIATADPQELSELRRVACSECWAPGTENEGVNLDCPQCKGEGVEKPFFHDTRYVSAAARALFSGVKVTETRIEIKTKDQMKAWEMIARHLGMFVDKSDLRLLGKDGQPIEPVVLTAIDPIEAAKAYQRLMNGE